MLASTIDPDDLLPPRVDASGEDAALGRCLVSVEDQQAAGVHLHLLERLEQAAIREAREETSLDVRLVGLLGCYSDPERDERGHTVSAVYVATASGIARASDDAKNLAFFKPGECPDMAFDHAQIIEDYLHYRATGRAAPLRFQQ